jgi:hypothetical protein
MIVPVRIDLTIFHGKPWDMTFDWTLDGLPGPTVNGQMSMKSVDTGSTSVVVASYMGGQVTFPVPGRIRIDLSALETGAIDLGLYEWDYDALDALNVPLGQVAAGRARVRLDP